MQNYFVFGLAGTGKDTFAALMKKHHGTSNIALADAIRAEYVRFFGRHDYKTNRTKMIEIGENYKTIYGVDVWCKEAEKQFGWNDGRLIMDGRYAEEYHYFVYDRGYTPIRLWAKEDIRFERLQRRDGTIQRESLQYEKQRFIPDSFSALTINTSGTILQLEDIVKELKV